MKKVSVRVKRFKIVQSSANFDEPTAKDPGFFETELEEFSRDIQKETEAAYKVYEAYCAMFPDDKPMYFEDDCEGYMDGMLNYEGRELYAWSVENHKHWWEKEDLPNAIILDPEKRGLL